MMWNNTESGMKKTPTDAEAIEIEERHYFDLQGEPRRLFVYLSNSLYNLNRC